MDILPKLQADLRTTVEELQRKYYLKPRSKRDPKQPKQPGEHVHRDDPDVAQEADDDVEDILNIKDEERDGIPPLAPPPSPLEVENRLRTMVRCIRVPAPTVTEEEERIQNLQPTDYEGRTQSDVLRVIAGQFNSKRYSNAA